MNPILRTGAGASDTETLRVIMASDSPAPAASLPTGASTSALQEALNTLVTAANALLTTIRDNALLTIPSASAAAVTPHDSTNFAGGVCRGLYVGGAGNLVAIVNGTAITFTGVPAGTVLPIRATRVNATSTTATAIVALY